MQKIRKFKITKNITKFDEETFFWEKNAVILLKGIPNKNGGSYLYLLDLINVKFAVNFMDLIVSNKTGNTIQVSKKELRLRKSRLKKTKNFFYRFDIRTT